MGTKAKKKSIVKNLKKASAQFSTSKGDSPDFVVCSIRPFCACLCRMYNRTGFLCLFLCFYYFF